jgi:hypothetical protein
MESGSFLRTGFRNIHRLQHHISKAGVNAIHSFVLEADKAVHQVMNSPLQYLKKF